MKEDVNFSTGVDGYRVMTIPSVIAAIPHHGHGCGQRRMRSYHCWVENVVLAFELMPK